ncbi:MAG: hypothetical protein U1E60_04470 [Reyranellaceae bacterium]
MTIPWPDLKTHDTAPPTLDLSNSLQLEGPHARFHAMIPAKLHEDLLRADAHAALGRDCTARQAAYIEALSRDGHDAATARKLLKAFEEMEALHGLEHRPVAS